VVDPVAALQAVTETAHIAMDLDVHGHFAMHAGRGPGLGAPGRRIDRRPRPRREVRAGLVGAELSEQIADGDQPGAVQRGLRHLEAVAGFQPHQKLHQDDGIDPQILAQPGGQGEAFHAGMPDLLGEDHADGVEKGRCCGLVHDDL
jgi:hypothetical protein